MREARTTTFWAAVFVVIACVSLVTIDVWRSWSARSQQLLQLSSASTNLALAMMRHADDTIKVADITVTDMVERIENGDIEPRRLNALMTQYVNERPQLNGIFVYDAHGRWLANSRPSLDKQLNNADREYFKFHQRDDRRDAHIGQPLVSRSTGKWVIPVSRRINRADGSFGGVALATVEIDYFNRFYQEFDIGKKGAAGLVTNDGMLLVRRPFSDDTVGKSIRNSELYRRYTDVESAGSGFIRSSQDNELRMNSYRALHNYPLFVTAALAKDEALAGWRRDTILHSTGTTLFVLLIALFGWRLVRQIETRAIVEAELRSVRDNLKEANQSLERLALYDGLTGLANRSQFDTVLGKEFWRSTRDDNALGLVMIDIDYFKQYNDTYGHVAGDACLQAVSRVVLQLAAKRPGDLAARYGGEEIAVVLPGADQQGALMVAELICSAIAELRIAHSGSPLGIITVSAGAASRREAACDSQPNALIAAADKALYAAKHAGRNRAMGRAGAAGPSA